MSQFSNSLYLNIGYRLPVLGFCIFIFWQSSNSGLIEAPLFPYDDKVMHFLAYGLLSILALRDLQEEKPFWSTSKIRLIAVLFSSLYGLSDEVHQSFVPERFASIGDFIADCFGSIVGGISYQKFSNRT